MKTIEIDIEELPQRITRAELSRIANVSTNTVDNWVKAGKLAKGRRTTANRYWDRHEVIAALRSIGLIIDKRPQGRA